MVEFVPWSEFLAGWDWQQGEHVSCIGPTGTGKTTLIKAILHRRRWVIFLASKPVDENLDPVNKRLPGFAKVRSWPPTALQYRRGRLVLWPRMDRMGDIAEEARIVGDMLEYVYSAGSWCVAVDELGKVSRDLGQSHRLRLLWQQGRSLGVSIVGATQRPAHVPLELYSQASHLFLWQTSDDVDLKRLQGIGGMDARTIRDEVRQLGRHEVLYVGVRSRRLARTRVEV